MQLMMKSPADGLGPLLHTSARLLSKRFERRLSEHELSSAQWRMLLCLFRTGPSCQARLAEWLEIEPISVSRMIDRMAQGGWVERVPDLADRRIKQVVPTDKTLNIFKNL